MDLMIVWLYDLVQSEWLTEYTVSDWLSEADQVRLSEYTVWVSEYTVSEYSVEARRQAASA